MLAQIVPHLPGKVVLAHGGLQKAELLHEALGLLGQKRKIVIDLIDQAQGRLVAVEVRIQLRAHFPPVERNDERFLHGILLNMVFHRFLRIS